MDFDWLQSLTAYSCDLAHAFVDLLEPVSPDLIHIFHGILESCSGSM